ncbi:hypothetical protein E4U54_007893 [Claviceps lovelessii]|nr:hypothetical protein E4U54_007893 [Claviceps lovelessii]
MAHKTVPTQVVRAGGYDSGLFDYEAYQKPSGSLVWQQTATSRWGATAIYAGDAADHATMK